MLKREKKNNIVVKARKRKIEDLVVGNFKDWFQVGNQKANTKASAKS